MDYRKKFFLGFCIIMFSLCNGQKPKLYLGTELQKISETQYNKIEKESHLLLSSQVHIVAEIPKESNQAAFSYIRSNPLVCQDRSF